MELHGPLLLAGLEKAKKAVRASVMYGNRPRNGKAKIFYKPQTQDLDVEAKRLFDQG